MTDLLDIQEKLQDTHVAITKLVREVANNPKDVHLGQELESLYKRQEKLESSFFKAADSESVDVCSYRLIRDGSSSFPIAALGETLKTFQSLLTTLYNAVANGAKATSRVSAEIAEKTTLDFSHTYAGSLGLVFTVPNERLLFESDLDRTIDVLFKMLKVQTTDSIQEYASLFGVAPIRRMYEWAFNQVRYSLTAAIAWRHEDKVNNKILIQAPEAIHLCEIINSTSEVKQEEITVTGELVGGDTATREFHLQFPGTNVDEIKGKFADGFTPPGELILNHNYRAKLLKNTVVHFAIDKEDMSFQLVSLIPI